MKTIQYFLLINYSLLLSSCGFSNEKKEVVALANPTEALTAPTSQTQLNKNEIMETTIQKNVFSGNFSGTQNGLACVAILKSTGQSVTGTFSINGKYGQLVGTSNQQNCSGTITDDETGSQYPFNAKMVATIMNLEIDLTAFGGQVIAIEMQKANTENPTKKTSKNNTLDQSLIGLWRNTEIYSSGSGEYRFSVSTDYFMLFNSDGTISNWSGKSGGGTADVSVMSDEGEKNYGEWYTEGDQLWLVDPKSNQKAPIQYYVENNKMMFTGNGQRKIFERIN